MALFWRIFDTFLLVAGLVYIFARYVNPYFKKRKADISLSIEQAKDARDKAEEFHNESRRNLDEIKKEIEYIKEEATKEAEAEKVRIIEEAKISAEKILENYLTLAKLEIENQKRKFYRDALDTSFNIAEDIIRTELTEEALNKINSNLLKISGEAIVK